VRWTCAGPAKTRADPEADLAWGRLSAVPARNAAGAALTVDTLTQQTDLDHTARPTTGIGIGPVPVGLT
jgi:hypothetical protein